MIKAPFFTALLRSKDAIAPGRRERAIHGFAFFARSSSASRFLSAASGQEDAIFSNIEHTKCSAFANDSDRIISRLLAKKAVYMFVLPELLALPMST